MKKIAIGGVPAVLAASLVLAQGATAAPASQGQAAAPSVATAAPNENTKLNRTPTPKLGWYSCYRGARCATAELPLDYDDPKGAKTTVAVLKMPATGRKDGTLFVNPGGPGGSATEMAFFSSEWATPQIRKHFDIVGVDPRGIGFSDNVRCLSPAQVAPTQAKLSSTPVGWTQEQRHLWASKKYGKACSTRTLARSMSTAEVARDMEMVRRAIGDGPLSYIGFSYGSHLGTTYANMFPGNFRSIVIDGTLDPRAWSGTSSNQSQPLDFRLDSGKGAWKAMVKILGECEKAGPDRCSFAGYGDTRKTFDGMAASLRRRPVTTTDEAGDPYTITYSTFIDSLLGALYQAEAPTYVDYILADTKSLMDDAQAARRAGDPAPRAPQRLVDAIKKASSTPVQTKGFPYGNSLDSFLSVTCTDSRETTKIADYPAFAKQADQEAPHFGRSWLFSSAGCAGDSFTGEDEDVYMGPYNRLTPKGVLVVGNYWDPATAYTGAVSTRRALGRARLVSSDSWGHTAYGVSECVTKRVDRYLLSGTSPREDVVCPAEKEMFPAWESEEPRTVPDIVAEHQLPVGTKARPGFPAPGIG